MQYTLIHHLERCRLISYILKFIDLSRSHVAKLIIAEVYCSIGVERTNISFMKAL